MVDDDLMNIEVLNHMLNAHNVRSESANNGLQAIQMIKKRIDKVKQGKAQMYKIILLDYSMAEMDGP